MKYIFFVLSLLASLLINSQDFKSIDSIVDRYPNKFNSISEFADKVSSNFSTVLEKTRAVYYWVSNHVFYDYNEAKINYRKRYYFKNQKELEIFRRRYAENVLRRKTGICEGYSQLMKFVLRDLGIKCEIVSGYAKNQFKHIGVIQKNTSHAWNAVFVDGKWHLLDATWSTGNDEDEPGKFEFDDFYFFTKPELMILSHYAKDSKWLLLEKPMSKSAFFYAPIFYNYYHKSGLALTKMNGLIKSSHQITLTFDLIDEANTYSYYIKGSRSRYSQPLKITKIGDKYVAKIPFRKGRKTGLTVYANRKACMTFKIY